MKTYRKHPDDSWLGWAALVVLTVALLLALALLWPAKSHASIKSQLWLPMHLDRQITLDPDWVFRHYPTISTGRLFGEQIEFDGSQHTSLYFKLTRTAKTNLPEAAYSHDSAGRRIHDKVHHDLLIGNPASSAWRDYVRGQCRLAHTGWDADSCFGDGVGLASYYRMTATPVDSAGDPIPRSGWVARIVGMLNTFPAELRVVANTAGWESPDVAAAAWARSVEGNPNTPREYEQTMLGSRAWILAYTNGPERLARFLLYAGPEDRFAYWARDRPTPATYLRHFTMRIGQPTEGPRETTDGVVRRHYTTGYAVWNSSGVTRFADLHGQYRDVNGQTRRTWTLQPGDALVLEVVS